MVQVHNGTTGSCNKKEIPMFRHGTITKIKLKKKIMVQNSVQFVICGKDRKGLHVCFAWTDREDIWKNIQEPATLIISVQRSGH